MSFREQTIWNCVGARWIAISLELATTQVITWFTDMYICRWVNKNYHVSWFILFYTRSIRVSVYQIICNFFLTEVRYPNSFHRILSTILTLTGNMMTKWKGCVFHVASPLWGIQRSPVDFHNIGPVKWALMSYMMLAKEPVEQTNKLPLI